jgi:hypothetical protein
MISGKPAAGTMSMREGLEPTVIVDIVIVHLLKAASDPRTTDMSVITEPKKCECAKSHYDVEHFHAKRDH